MCGIAGLMTRHGAAPDRAVLDRMAAALTHRGPDGGGVHVSGGVGLVHTRLAIIDLATGDQPLFGPGPDHERSALVANGEIYNHVELRAGLSGAAFRTGSDCEPPLHLQADRGDGFVDSLRGMYALALHDPRRRELKLARDPFGIKPLYLAETPDAVLFASEPRALLASGLVPRDPDPGKILELLQLQFTTGAATPFRAIRRLPPGALVTLRDGRIISETRREALPADIGPQDADARAALARFDSLFEDAVTIHQRSDVPYGMFLSGGVDSSAVLAMMARLNPRPVRAYTAFFPDAVGAVGDERAAAAAAARAAGAERIDVPFTEADFWAMLPDAVTAMDDPVADYAILPTLKLARAARAEGLKVVLSGEGGDEVFGGYGRYRGAMRPWPLTRAVRRRGILDGLGVLRDSPVGWRDGLAAIEREGRRPGWSRLQRAQAADVAGWLPNDLLVKLDRCLMAEGVEGRVPLLDDRLAGFAFALPDRLKVVDGRGKWLLRRWLATALPESDPLARKRGFTVPVATWIRARGRPLGRLVAAQPGVAALCRPEAVEALFGDPAPRAGKAAWSLLFFALWHQHYVVGQRLVADVEESLALL